jgi:LmbE family N-acetylglucosaminyl deacetylase
MDIWIIILSTITAALVIMFLGMRILNNYHVPALDMFPRKDRNYRLLLLFPHPDDESFASGGTIARYAANEKIDVQAVCFTRGEAGEFKGKQNHSVDLGKIRTKEYHSALEILGISNFEIKDFPDGKLESTGLLQEAVRKTLSQFQPTTVISYEEGGLYNHPDHTALTRTILELYHRNKQYDLYLATIPKKLESKFGFSIKNEPNISVKIWRQKIKKLRAFTAHASQFGGFSLYKKVSYLLFSLLQTREYYYKVPK